MMLGQLSVLSLFVSHVGYFKRSIYFFMIYLYKCEGLWLQCHYYTVPTMNTTPEYRVRHLYFEGAFIFTSALFVVKQS